MFKNAKCSLRKQKNTYFKMLKSVICNLVLLALMQNSFYVVTVSLQDILRVVMKLTPNLIGQN